MQKYSKKVSNHGLFLHQTFFWLIMEFYPLSVRSIERETLDTVSIEFEIPESLHTQYAYKPGQYITLKMNLAGQELRRSYSMSSSPIENKLVISVKKVKGGRVSGFLNDQLKPGDLLEVSTPEGRFSPKLHADQRRTYYLFGSGSGITPLMSILKTVLENEPMSSIFLLYGSRNEEGIIFKEQLDKLSERYSGQLMVEHILSQPKKESSGGLLGMFKKSSANWQGKIGRIDDRMVAHFLEENQAHTPQTDCQYFVCGPGNMADVVQSALLNAGISNSQIYTEHFLNSDHVPGEFAISGGGKRVVVMLKGERIELSVPEGATILDVLVKEKYNPPYSCTAGACSTCMAKVTNGSVKMDVCYGLDPGEVKDGYILTCQAHPVSDVVELTYDL